ncbi:MAG: hypothetical protein U0165_08665 [Polyangiaceae bacterium]
MATVVLTGAPLLLGCIWDLHVMSAQRGRCRLLYTRAHGVARRRRCTSSRYRNALRRALSRTFIDIVGSPGSIAMLLLAVCALSVRKKSTLETPQSNEAPRPYVLPLVATTLAYLAIPSIFASTHQVYQRFAQWLILQR